MSGCPGSGQAMTKVSGTITFIGANHESLKVKKGEKVTVLLVHPRCPNHDQLVAKIAKLKVGRTFVGQCYTKNGKLYLCQVGGAACPGHGA